MGRDDMDRLAERMAKFDEGSVTAGRAVGLSPQRSKDLFKQMRKRLGRQAQ